MKYMSTNEPERFILDKSIELVGDGNVMVLVPWYRYIDQLRRYVHSRGLTEFGGASLNTMMIPFPGDPVNYIFFRSSKLVASLKSISIRGLIILEPVSPVSRQLAIERTRAQLDPEIWRVNEF